MENIKNCISWSGSNPLSLRVSGTGEYVKKQCANLVESFAQAEADHYEEIRQDNE